MNKPSYNNYKYAVKDDSKYKYARNDDYKYNITLKFKYNCKDILNDVNKYNY